jgi:hypothetical protein
VISILAGQIKQLNDRRLLPLYRRMEAWLRQRFPAETGHVEPADFLGACRNFVSQCVAIDISSEFDLTRAAELVLALTGSLRLERLSLWLPGEELGIMGGGQLRLRGWQDDALLA